MCYLYGVVVAFAIIPADSRQMIFGIFSLDFTDGSYKMVGDLIPIYPLNMILVMLFSVGTPIGLVALKEVCFQKIPYYRDVPPIFKKIRSIQQKK
ncbi:hypothetical protein FACS1894218_3940 [Bacilli bacterium]|nr:hypothetical protein FACS1894218_3940 [Bacilli bacterium]